MAKSAQKLSPARPKGRTSATKVAAKEAKAARTRSTASGRSDPAAKARERPGTSKPNKSDSDTKQSRVLLMLGSPAGATIAAMMAATGWQQHSVRGFLAGVVRKRLKLILSSDKVDGARVYRIARGGDAKTQSRKPKRRAA